jgi:hypothetical protein
MTTPTGIAQEYIQAFGRGEDMSSTQRPDLPYGEDMS